MFRRSLFAAMVLILLSAMSTSVHAARKESYIGKALEEANTRLQAIKKDYDDYNTFLFNVRIFNESKKNCVVKVYRNNISSQGQMSDLSPFYTASLPPFHSLNNHLESKAYPWHRTHSLVISCQGASDFIFEFDPAKTDIVEFIVRKSVTNAVTLDSITRRSNVKDKLELK